MMPSSHYSCPLHYGEERQVQVHGIPGVQYLPCSPVFGCSNTTTRIPNGTFVRFVSWRQLGTAEDSIVWEFVYADDETVRVWVSPEALTNNWLWKAKRLRPVGRAGRRPVRW